MVFGSKTNNSEPLELYLRAKELAEEMYSFPYNPPEVQPEFIKKDTKLIRIISAAYKTTRTHKGTTQQTTISASDRIRCQEEFKKRIFYLLNKCLTEDIEFGPAYLLFPKVAGFNTRAKDRKALIGLSEKLLPFVKKIKKATKAYSYIKQDISNYGKGVNCFHKVERHLADFYYDLAKLYRDTKQPVLAKEIYRKASKLLPQIYGRGKKNKI